MRSLFNPAAPSAEPVVPAVRHPFLSDQAIDLPQALPPAYRLTVFPSGEPSPNYPDPLPLEVTLSPVEGLPNHWTIRFTRNGISQIPTAGLLQIQFADGQPVTFAATANRRVIETLLMAALKSAGAGNPRVNVSRGRRCEILIELQTPLAPQLLTTGVVGCLPWMPGWFGEWLLVRDLKYVTGDTGWQPDDPESVADTQAAQQWLDSPALYNTEPEWRRICYKATVPCFYLDEQTGEPFPNFDQFEYLFGYDLPICRSGFEVIIREGWNLIAYNREDNNVGDSSVVAPFEIWPLQAVVPGLSTMMCGPRREETLVEFRGFNEISRNLISIHYELPLHITLEPEYL